MYDQTVKIDSQLMREAETNSFTLRLFVYLLVFLFTFHHPVSFTIIIMIIIFPFFTYYLVLKHHLTARAKPWREVKMILEKLSSQRERESHIFCLTHIFFSKLLLLRLFFVTLKQKNEFFGNLLTCIIVNLFKLFHHVWLEMQQPGKTFDTPEMWMVSSDACLDMALYYDYWIILEFVTVGYCFLVFIQSALISVRNLDAIYLETNISLKDNPITLLSID